MTMNSNKNDATTAIPKYILLMMVRVGIGLVLFLGLMLGIGVAVDHWLGGGVRFTILAIMVSAPIAVVLIFFYVRRVTKHLNGENVVENPEKLTTRKE